MTVANRISVSFDDDVFTTLERLSTHTHKSKAELIRTMVEEFIREHPDRFRRDTNLSIKRQKNIVLPE